LDWTGTPRHELFSRLAAQDHRRFIKTHTPLDGIPIDRRATYIVVARHPLDMAVSLYHQGDNIDRDRLRQLTGQPEPADPPPPRPPLHQWLSGMDRLDGSPAEQLDSLPGVVWHVSDAWRRRQEPNIVLVHYDDLAADLEGEMRGLAGACSASPCPSSSLGRAGTGGAVRGDAGRAPRVAPIRPTS
jgi:aryl sulfotransferase